MADFVGLLKKTIDAQNNMTPQLRQRIYERAKAAVERKLSESPLSTEVVNEQRAILQRAIDEVEAYYLAQEGLDELLVFPFEEGDSQEENFSDNQEKLSPIESKPYQAPFVDDQSTDEDDIQHPVMANEPNLLPEHDDRSQSSVLPQAYDDEYNNQYVQASTDHEAISVSQANNSFDSHTDDVRQSSSHFAPEPHRFGIVTEPAPAEPLSDTFVLPIADQHRFSADNRAETIDIFETNSTAGEQAKFEEIERQREEERRIAAEQAEEQQRLEEIERQREEERRLAEEQTLRQAEEAARLEEIERQCEEERRIAAEQVLKQAEEQALRQAEEAARLEEIERQREEERRIADEQALEQAQERVALETEQLRLAEEHIEVAEEARFQAEQKAKDAEEAKIAAEASALDQVVGDNSAHLAALHYAQVQEDAQLEVAEQAREEDLAKQASQEHLDAEEKAALEVDARLSIEGARTILPRKAEKSNFDAAAYRSFDGNLDIAAERDIAGSRKDNVSINSDEIMPMPPLVRGVTLQTEVASDTGNERVVSSINDELQINTNDKNSTLIDDISAPKVDDNFDVVSDIFNPAARREKNRTRSYVGIIIIVLLIIISALAAGIYFYLEGKKTEGATAPLTPPSVTVTDSSENKPDSKPHDIADSNVNNGASGGDVQVVTPPETVDDTSQTTPNTVTPDKITERLLPDGSEVTVGPSQQGADTGSEGISSTQATSIAQRSTTAKFYERSTSILPASLSTGIVNWKLIRNKSKDNGPDELAVRGDVIIPGKDLTAKITIRPNTDLSFNADFLIDLVFIVPENFDGGSIADVGRVSFKAAENSTGQALSGMLSQKLGENFFIIAVSSNASGSNRNLNLDVMRQFRWIAIPVIYENGRVGEFVIDKGDLGDNIFKQVIDDWISKGKTAQNTHSAGNSAPTPTPAPSNVPVPSSPAVVPATNSVPVPSAPPAQ